MPELAVGYIQLVAETSRIPPAIRQALNSGDAAASNAGRSMGDRMSSALGGALKKGAAAAGAAGIAAAGVAMTKGFQRLQAIDDAKGKLEGLGHTTASTAKIMDSAMASVKGTAYGLGDAATIAAGAVAAGVKPGQELTKYLSMTADAASIAGVELGEMGSILNTVQTSGSAMNDSLDQMAERGIPIFQWLAEEMGVTAGEVQDLASKGEVSSDIFFKAIQKNIGGAAQAAGKTVRGSFSNMIAALGRLGAAAQAPSFARLPGTFTSITAAIDKVTPKVKDFAIAFDAKVFDEWAPRAREAFEAFKDTGILGDSKSAFVGLSEAAVALLPALGQIGGALAQASAALGVGTWQIFLAAMNATAGVLNGVAPILNGIGDIMQAQPGLVMTALAAWMAFKTVPGIMTRMSSALTPITSRMAAATTATTGFARANNAVVQMTAASHSRLSALAGIAQTTNGRFRDLATNRFIPTATAMVRMSQAAGVSQQRMMQLAGVAQTANGRFRDLATNRFIPTATAMQRMSAQAGIAQGRFGSMVASAGRVVPVLGSMQTAFVNASVGAQRFGAAAGSFAAVRAGMMGLKTAAGSVVNALGGGLNVAMMGVTIAAGAMISSFQRQSQLEGEKARTVQALADSYLELGSAMRESRGESTDEVMGIANGRIEKYTESVNAAAKADGKWHEAMYDGLFKAVGVLGEGEKGLAEMHDEAAGKAQQQQEAYKQLGMTTEDVGKAVYGSAQSWTALSNKLIAMGPAGTQVRHDLAKLRTDFMEQKIIASRVTPGYQELSNAMQVMGDKTASASEKLNALKTAMNALNPARNEAEAMSKWGDAIRAAAQAAEGIDASAFDMKGKLDTSTEAGKALKEALVGIADASAEAATSGADMKKVNAGNEDQFKALAAATGKSVEEIRTLYKGFGGNAVDIAVKLQGAGDTIQQLGAIKSAMDANPDLKVFTLEAKGSEGVQAALKQLGIEVTKAPDGKTIDVDLTGDAGKKLQQVIDTVAIIPTGKNIQVGTPGGDAVFSLLKSMNIEVGRNNSKQIVADIPNGSPVLALLQQIGLEVETRNGKQIIVRADDSDYTKKRPGWVARETKIIDILTSNPNYMGPGSPIGGVTLPRASGAIIPARAYVDGGIRAAEAFANGGLKEISKPTRADIFAGRGDGTIFAEKETGGEAYIPLAPGKRSRSTDILAAVARMFGLELIPRDGSISGLLGGIAGGAVSKLLKSAGADGITRFADGGFNGKQLRELADGGHGASQPLTGAPYVWGGVNWGDCSGAVSAFARAAAGLAPFGGRMSTGSMGSDLPAIGFQRGAGKSGDMRVAYYNGGPGGGHAIGRLPDDVNVEMGGQNGGGMVGGPVGPDHPQFTDRWYLTVAQALDNAVGTLTLDSTTDDPATTAPTTTTTPDTVSKESTISGLVGDVVKTGVSGQIKDILDVFGVNDSPGALAAWAGLPVKDLSKTSVDPKKLREAEDKVADKETALKVAKQRLAEVEANKKSSQSARLAAKAAAEKAEREAKQAKEDLEKLKASEATTATITPGKKLRDPGTHRPKRGEDTGVGKLSSVDAIKNAFKGGLREAWRSGDQWSATDWIVNKESTWKPDAQNGKYWGLIQAGEDVYRAAGVDPKTTDPALQAKAFDKYVDGRYKTPVDAKVFHEANNWYDQGGIAPRKGLMLKNINTPERVLSPRQTSAFEQMVRRDFQSGIGTDVIVAKLDQLIKVVVAQGPNGVQPARDDRDFADKQRQKNRRLVAAGKGGRV